MPDAEDYAEFGRLLASPTSWTDAEAAYMQCVARSGMWFVPRGGTQVCWRLVYAVEASNSER